MIRQNARRTLLAAVLLCAAAPHLAAQSPELKLLRDATMEAQAKTVGQPCSIRGPQCIQASVHQLQTLIRDYTLWKLNESHGDTDALIRDLLTVEDVWALEQADRLLGGKADRKGRPPFAYHLKTGGGDLIVTINSFSTGGLALPEDAVIIQGFREEGGRYVFASETGDSLFGIFGEYHPARMLPPAADNEIWFILGGQVSGFMGHLDRVRIYSFDGQRFRELWAPEDREQMEFTFNGNQIRVEYLGSKNSVRFGFPTQHYMEEHLLILPGSVNRTLLVDLGEEVPKQQSPAKK